jgi:integrase
MKWDAKSIARLALPAGKTDAIYFDRDLPGFGLRLRDGGNGVRKSWIVQYRRAGGTRRMLLGSAGVLSIEQARKRAKDILAKVQLGEDPQADKAEQRARETFSMRALGNDYLQAKKPNLRPRSFVESERYLCGPLYFKPLQNMPVEQITRKDVAARVLAISRDSGPTTASSARAALSAMFKWGMQMGLCESNPVVGTPDPKKPRPRDRVLSDDELALVWRNAGDDDFGKIVRLLILTGQRRTEVGGVAWSELDLDRCVWVIPGARAKNGRRHTLPLSPPTLNVIESVPHRVGRDQLFGDRGDAGFGAWSRDKRALDERLGDQVAKWTLHDLRRSAATRMADLGVQPHIIEAVLNHYSGHRAGPAGIYNRSSYEREMKNALALWADHVRTLIEGGERKVIAMRSVP